MIGKYGSREDLKRNFLKKGSGINKSMLNNILRTKMSKPFTNSHKGYEIHINNQEFENLIKIYKNVPDFNPRSYSSQDKYSKNDTNLIQGWRI
jgi:hypothetical protein